MMKLAGSTFAYGWGNMQMSGGWDLPMHLDRFVRQTAETYTTWKNIPFMEISSLFLQRGFDFAGR
jgi:hypothetical protein